MQIYAQQPQTFSPVGSTEGSPHHQLHTGGPPVGASGMYHLASGMPVAPGAPGQQLPPGEQIHSGHMMPGQGPLGGQLPLGQMAPGQMAPGAGQMPPGAGQIPPSTGVDQSGYGQSGYQSSTQPQPVPADYQHIPPGGYPATTYGGGMIGQNPAVTTQQQGNIGAPTAQQPPQSEYQTFNMQGLSKNLIKIYFTISDQVNHNSLLFKKKSCCSMMYVYCIKLSSLWG